MAIPSSNVSGFRIRLFVMILVAVAAVTALGAFLTQRYLLRTYEEELRNSIQQKVAAAAHTRQVRQAVLAGICIDLASQPRIHAALEDNALDLLYPSAANELRQIMRERLAEPAEVKINARFYRFLDSHGKIIPPQEPEQHGNIALQHRAKLELESLPSSQQVGYLRMDEGGEKGEVVEVFAVPIISNETFASIAALVVGFPYDVRGDFPPEDNLTVGIWTGAGFEMPSLAQPLANDLENEIRSFDPGERDELMATIDLAGIPYRLLLRPLNAASVYPPAYEIYLSSLVPLNQRQSAALKRILLTAMFILAMGLIAAHFTAQKLSRPVEELAEASEEEHQQRINAEVALDSTSRELERAARFSADASHQLKTPVAVVRAGLEELLIDPELPERHREEVRSLIAHTGRLTHVIEDLLLLSKLDAGRLEVPLQPENLRLIIDALVDDLSILPETAQLKIELEIPESLWIRGNRSYTSLILQSLLENAWKYNRAGGRIRIQAEVTEEQVVCSIGNTGKKIPEERRPYIFDRFHRGSSGENVPGYGLGLNLATELTRLHEGSLELACSTDDWTEFRLTLKAAVPTESAPTLPL